MSFLERIDDFIGQYRVPLIGIVLLAIIMTGLGRIVRMSQERQADTGSGLSNWQEVPAPPGLECWSYEGRDLVCVKATTLEC